MIARLAWCCWYLVANRLLTSLVALVGALATCLVLVTAGWRAGCAFASYTRVELRDRWALLAWQFADAWTWGGMQRRDRERRRAQRDAIMRARLGEHYAQHRPGCIPADDPLDEDA